MVCTDELILMPKYLKWLTTGIFAGKAMFLIWSFRGKKADFVQFILYPDISLKRWKIEHQVETVGHSLNTRGYHPHTKICNVWSQTQ